MKLERVHRVISQSLGELPLQAGGSTLKPEGVKREVKEGEIPENTGYTEKEVAAELKMKLNATGALGIEELSKLGDETLTIWTTGGKQYSMPNAWCAEPGELGDAEMDITFNAAKCIRLV